MAGADALGMKVRLSFPYPNGRASVALAGLKQGGRRGPLTARSSDKTLKRTVVCSYPRGGGAAIHDRAAQAFG
eukprot:364100-Chlamydomonas_euryale.AAC.4